VVHQSRFLHYPGVGRARTAGARFVVFNIRFAQGTFHIWPLFDRTSTQGVIRVILAENGGHEMVALQGYWVTCRLWAEGLMFAFVLLKTPLFRRRNGAKARDSNRRRNTKTHRVDVLRKRRATHHSRAAHKKASFQNTKQHSKLDRLARNAPKDA